MNELKIEGQEDSVIKHEEFILPDEGGTSSHLKVEVNWIEAVKPFKKIRLTDTTTGKEFIVDKAQLMSILFIISDEEDQQKFISEKMTNKVVFERYFDVKMTKDYRKGETMTVRLPISSQLEEFKRRPMKFDPKAGSAVVIKK